MIGVLVVDDDFRVAEVHSWYVGQVAGLKVIGVAHTAADAVRSVADLKPDLVLLDNYLPDRPGIDLAAELRVDIFMVTADSSATSVRAAFAAGAVNYLIKPFSSEQLTSRLRAYVRYRTLLGDQPNELSQQAVDRAIDALHEADKPPTPKGQSPVTARLVTEALRRADNPRTAADVADELGISRATAQRYLAALADDGRATLSLRYGSTGRPEHQYVWITAL
ncbi:response regulator [Kribbella sp. NPDC026596]|uniref:response regulator n=1 Tax=Kribbella sp. NPDC026596 TaxID=3155122 RepID=UPI0033C08B3B